MRRAVLLSLLLAGCQHSFVRPADDVRKADEDYAALLAKKTWKGSRLLPLRRDLEFSARVQRPEGEQILDGTILGASASQQALVVDLGNGANALPVSWLRRIKVNDTTFRDRGRLVTTAIGAGYGSLVGLSIGLIVASESGRFGPSSLMAMTLPAGIGAGAGWLAGTFGAKSFYIVDFENDQWDWTFNDP